MRRALLPLLLLLTGSLAWGQTCRVGELPQSGTVDGTLSSSDCRVLDFLPDVTATARAAAWRLNVTTTAVYRIRMTSSVVDSFLFIANSTRTFESDNNGGGGRDAELLVQLTPGSYLVVAVAATTSLGPYRIAVSNEPPRTCRTTTLTPGLDVDSELGPDDCRVVDVIPLLNDATPVSTWKLEITKPVILTVTMKSSVIDSYMELLNANFESLATDDDSGGGLNSRIRISLDTGTYQLLTTLAAPGNGPFTLRAEIEDRRSCPPVPLQAGDTLQGSLDASTSCRALDVFFNQTSESPLDVYEMNLTEPVIGRLAMNSRAFDTVLALRDARGNIVSSNDNASSTTSNSAISTSLAAGKYTVIALYGRGTPGAYDLSFTTEPLRQCQGIALNLNGLTTGSLSTSGCRYLDVTQPSTISNPAAVFTFTLDRSQVLTITGTGLGLTPLVELRNAAGDLLSSTTRGSAVSQLVLPGDYKVVVYSQTGNSGTFSLTSAAREPARCVSDVLALDATLNGELVANDCPLRDLIPSPITALPADVFTLEATTDSTVTVSVDSTTFSPYVLVLNAQGQLVTVDNALGSTSTQAKFRVTTGTYTVVVTTLSNTGGTYQIRAVTGNPATGSTEAFYSSVGARRIGIGLPSAR